VDNMTIVNNLISTEYLNYEDKKFSKSRGVGVFGDNAKDTDIPADVWRFYLFFIRPETQDSVFMWDDFALRNNTELLNNLGNFVNRSLSFLAKFFDSVVPKMVLTNEDENLLACVTKHVEIYVDNMEKVKIRDALRCCLRISRLGNQYLQSNKAWVLIKGSEEERIRAGTVIGLGCNLACLLGVLLHPFLPATSKIIVEDQCRAPLEAMRIVRNTSQAGCFQVKVCCSLAPGHVIGTPFPLFKKIEPEEVHAWKIKFGAHSC